MDYKKVMEDHANGKIDRKKWALVMDNDGGHWRYDGKGYDSEWVYRAQDIMTERYGDPDGYSDIVKVLVAAGINAEWC